MDVYAAGFHILDAESLVVNRVFYLGEVSSQEEAWLQRQPRRLITFSISTRMEIPSYVINHNEGNIISYHTSCC